MPRKELESRLARARTASKSSAKITIGAFSETGPLTCGRGREGARLFLLGHPQFRFSSNSKRFVPSDWNHGSVPEVHARYCESANKSNQQRSGQQARSRRSQSGPVKNRAVNGRGEEQGRGGRNKDVICVRGTVRFKRPVGMEREGGGIATRLQKGSGGRET